MSIKVLVVDDHDLVRMGITRMLMTIQILKLSVKRLMATVR